MEQFTLEKYLENPSRKVVTKDGRQVRIVCWDLKSNTPIIAAIQWNQEREDCYCYNTIGRCANNVSELDLFFADEGDELTEFEKELEMMMVSFSNGNLGSDVIKEIPKQKLHNYAHRLLDLARKKVLKDLPKWKKNLLPNIEDCTGFNSENFCYKGYYINYQELFGILPKEE